MENENKAPLSGARPATDLDCDIASGWGWCGPFTFKYFPHDGPPIVIGRKEETKNSPGH